MQIWSQENDKAGLKKIIIINWQAGVSLLFLLLFSFRTNELIPVECTLSLHTDKSKMMFGFVDVLSLSQATIFVS